MNQELLQAAEELWNAQLYKIVLSNVGKHAAGTGQQGQASARNAAGTGQQGQESARNAAGTGRQDQESVWTVMGKDASEPVRQEQEAVQDAAGETGWKLVRCQYRKVILNRLESGWQAEQYTEKQVFHENLSEDRVKAYVLEALSSGFRQCNAWDGEWEHTIRISKGGKVTSRRKRTAQAPKKKQTHDRKKHYILEEGTVIPPLQDMGIFTAEGKIVRSMYDKYRQINRFVELIDDEIDSLPKDHPLTVIDFGCGKSYLTFILYYYLVEQKGLDVQITGLDLKEDVIRNCNRAAEKYGYENLHFELGDINGYDCPHPVDMVLSLHACDTATDYALYNAVRWKAKLIFSVPCCQHELNRQMKSEELSILTRYGVVQERTAALMTDAIRGNLLTACGYKTQLLEFVDLSHTPKNILIRAVRTVIPQPVRQEARREVEELKRTFGFRPTLDGLLFPDLQ